MVLSLITRARILEQVANSQSFDASQLRNFRSYDISQLPILKHFAAKIKTQSCENLVALQRCLSALATAFDTWFTHCNSW